MTQLALSLKQPWAALLAHGHKTIEVRRWTTQYRGPVLIHAARVPDERPEAQTLVPPELLAATQLSGGIIGVGTLSDVKSYRSQDLFQLDQRLHLNDPHWFEERGLYGFCFTDLRVVPFRRVPGYFRLFEVDVEVEVPPAPAEPDAARQRFRRLVRSLRRSSREGE